MAIPHPIRILIVDDHPIFRDGLRRLIEGEPDLNVVGEAVNAEEAIRLASAVTPDLVLLDVAMPKTSGLEALVSLTESAKPPVVMLLTAGIDKADIVKALQLGARGLVLKESATSLLFKAIRIVMDGGYWVGRDSVPDLLLALRSLGAGQQERVEPMPAFQLTQRELQVISLVVSAAGNKKIAETLSISEKTVKHHLTNIFEKLNVTSRLELALFAAHNNLIAKE